MTKIAFMLHASIVQSRFCIVLTMFEEFHVIWVFVYEILVLRFDDVYGGVETVCLHSFQTVQRVFSKLTALLIVT